MRFLLLLFVTLSLYAEKPNLFLLNNYSEDINVTLWYMSEKLDGVRAYWDGENFVSRSGKIFRAPAFFTKDFPKFKLDGELWSKRADFENISSIVNSQNSKERWEQLTYNIFEVPDAKGDLLKRLSLVKETKYIKIIKQVQVKNKEDLNGFLQNVEKLGGEGVVVRDGSLKYYVGRDNNALKMKSYIDEECEVISHKQGKGKYENMLGSLLCKMGNEKIITIGSGFTKEQRENPPQIGSIITFKYYGFTSKGNPRFPIFLRLKE